MSKKSGDKPLTSLQDLPPDLNVDKQATWDDREARLESADREKIDTIVLSEDIQRGGKIRVTRRGPNQQNFSYVCTVPAEQWDTERSMEIFKAEYGGGDYECKTFRSNGQMYKPFSFSIDPRFKGRLDDDQIARLAAETKGSNEATSRQMMELMMQRPRDDGGLKASDMIKMMEMQSSKGDQMMIMMVTMMTEAQKSNATLLASVLGRPAPTSSESILLPLVLKMLETKQERTPMNELMEAMVTMKQLQEGKDPEDKEPEDMMTKIANLLGKAAPFVGAITGGNRPQLPTVMAQPESQPQPATEPRPVQPELPPLGPVGMQLPFMARQGLVFIIGKAEKNADPALYADMIIDNFSADQLPQLKKILTAPDWCFQLWGDESRVAHVRPWLEELRQLIISYDANSPASDAGGPDSGGIRTEQPSTGPGADTSVP